MIELRWQHDHRGVYRCCHSDMLPGYSSHWNGVARGFNGSWVLGGASICDLGVLQFLGVVGFVVLICGYIIIYGFFYHLTPNHRSRDRETSYVMNNSIENNSTTKPHMQDWLVNNSFVDGVYWCSTTISTVWFGDIVHVIDRFLVDHKGDIYLEWYLV